MCVCVWNVSVYMWLFIAEKRISFFFLSFALFCFFCFCLFVYLFVCFFYVSRSMLPRKQNHSLKSFIYSRNTYTYIHHIYCNLSLSSTSESIVETSIGEYVFLSVCLSVCLSLSLSLSPYIYIYIVSVRFFNSISTFVYYFIPKPTL